MQVIGLKVQKYIGKSVRENNNNFEYYEKEFERHVIFCINDKKEKFKIKLWYEEKEYYSECEIATWGFCKVEKIKRCNGYNYIPKDYLEFPDLEEGYHYNVNNELFSISYDGGNEYHPNGGYSINMNLFIPTKNMKKKRPVWIFVGDFNLGKSYISSHTDLSVYETNSNPKLKENIIEDIIVLGNKNKFSIEDVKDKLFGNPEICIVNFCLEEMYNKLQTNQHIELNNLDEEEDVDLDTIFKL